jgi:hypothetical protein
MSAVDGKHTPLLFSSMSRWPVVLTDTGAAELERRLDHDQPTLVGPAAAPARDDPPARSPETVDSWQLLSTE